MKGGVYLIATRKGTPAKVGQTRRTFDERLEENRKSGRLKRDDKVKVVGMSGAKRDRVESWAINKFEPIRTQHAPKVNVGQKFISMVADRKERKKIEESFRKWRLSTNLYIPPVPWR